MPRSLSKSEEKVNIRFVQEIEKYPCLYNYRLEEYAKRNVVDSAWEKVAKSFGDSVANCKEKWKNLRTVFVRKRKSPLSGSARKGSYYLNDVMGFIVPYIKVQNNDETQSNIPSPGSINNTDTMLSDGIKENAENSEGDDDGADETQIDGIVEKNNTNHLPLMANTSTKGAAKEKSVIGGRGKKEKCKTASNIEVFMEYFQQKKSKVNQQPDSARKSFLLSLVPEIESMTDIQFRQFRRHILDGIDNILSSSYASTPTSCQTMVETILMEQQM